MPSYCPVDLSAQRKSIDDEFGKLTAQAGIPPMFCAPTKLVVATAKRAVSVKRILFKKVDR